MTDAGGIYGNCSAGGRFGGGTIYSVNPDGGIHWLHAFAEGDVQGWKPMGRLTLGTDDAVYGVTGLGGESSGGVVFRFGLDGTYDRLTSFSSNNGGNPRPGLVLATDGNFYGSTFLGGTDDGGTIYRMTPQGELTTIHSFTRKEGQHPAAALIQGSDGNLYGTAYAYGANRYGTAFQCSLEGELKVLHAFAGGLDGGYPFGSLAEGPGQQFYGTTQGGGDCGQGSAFRVGTDGAFKSLHSFCATSRVGVYPNDGLSLGDDGLLYGTTETAVFSMTLQGSTHVLRAGLPNSKGALLQADPDTWLGVAPTGGKFDKGLLYELRRKA